MNELQFENKFIEYLTTGEIKEPNSIDPFYGKVVRETRAIYSVKGKLWEYRPEIKTTAALWDNFKKILEQHNQHILDCPLSIIEFNQVKKIISDLKTPYEAGQFLYGLNGISQIEIDLDDGRHVFLTVFDQKHIGAGNTVYQVVNQIQRPAIIAGKRACIFDTTLLINGLPIIQIEEKSDKRDINEALNQMHQYIDENQYSDIFSTLQILIGITPNNVKYMANTTSDEFNKDFAFNWQRENNAIVRDWKEFVDQFLTIPMAHQMATNYMILDGTKNKQMLKVMRPYQVYATQKVLKEVKQINFEFGSNKVGYIWHTTGSGKTITSFKTAWLISRLPRVDKVVFVVDRIALTTQTLADYQAYDPDFDEKDMNLEKNAQVEDTKNTNELSRKLKSKDNNIIITSVQKLDTLVKRQNFKMSDRNIVFIVDEAHRSTGGKSFKYIQKAFGKSAWIGYTGTPMFDETTTGLRTEEIFGELLHAYTIKEAIADRNVLGFKVDFETTIDETQMKSEYLPAFYREKYPTWSDEQIQHKIENLTEEDIDDAVSPSFYDENERHVQLVVEDIFKKWRNRSNDGKYNAMLTTNVGGRRPSIPMAMMYFDEFERVNKKNRENGKPTLKVAVTFSHSTSNDDQQLVTNSGLHRAMKIYNKMFDTEFGMDDVSGYTQDVISRLNKTAMDRNYLDLVIVVEQLLTGFNAEELNSLYVDRTLKGASLIQAYSRTNRVFDMENKPWGRVVNYRWPAQNEKLMNKAFAIYANKDSAVLSIEEQQESNEENGIIAKSFEDALSEVRKVVSKLKELTNEFQQLPHSERKKEEMFELLKEYNSGISKLKQYSPEEIDMQQSGFDYEKPEQLQHALGMTDEDEKMLTTVLTNELKSYLAEEKQIPAYQIELKMRHIKEIKINYDYLTELVEKLLNEVHEKKFDEAMVTKERINRFADELDDRKHAKEIKNAAIAIACGDYPTSPNFKYPAKLENGSEQVISEANKQVVDRIFLDFRIKWGLTEILLNEDMHELCNRHQYGRQDLDDAGQIRDIVAKGSISYRSLSNNDGIRTFSKIKYRNELRIAIYQLANEIVGGLG